MAPALRMTRSIKEKLPVFFFPSEGIFEMQVFWGQGYLVGVPGFESGVLPFSFWPSWQSNDYCTPLHYTLQL